MNKLARMSKVRMLKASRLLLVIASLVGSPWSCRAPDEEFWTGPPQTELQLSMKDAEEAAAFAADAERALEVNGYTLIYRLGAHVAFWKPYSPDGGGPLQVPVGIERVNLERVAPLYDVMALVHIYPLADVSAIIVRVSTSVEGEAAMVKCIAEYW